MEFEKEVIILIRRLSKKLKQMSKKTVQKKQLKKLCVNCKHAGDTFKLGNGGIPHLHCHHPDLKDEDMGWGSLREAFCKCDKFEVKERVIKRSNGRRDTTVA
jgi:hypothetical protein